MKVNILVAHGGGPTPVINSSLQGVIEAARESGKVDKHETEYYLHSERRPVLLRPA